LYFSDHGEEVYDKIDFSGHSADQVITQNIYEIPLLLWVSEKYKHNKSIPNNFNSKYLTDDLFHSIADLVDVKSEEVDSSRSIFSEHFKERKRIIRDTIDYDILFK
jgi:heptose-I-phosphate ethanolaminephosphotransferase